jgi:hypothetical protein
MKAAAMIAVALTAGITLTACSAGPLAGDQALCEHVEAATADMATIADEADGGGTEGTVVITAVLARLSDQVIEIGDERGLEVTDELAARVGIASYQGANGEFAQA